jgi:hypothetical protein
MADVSIEESSRQFVPLRRSPFSNIKEEIMRRAVLVAIIAGAFGLVGNLVTAFGPSWVSWYKKPSYVDTEAYKELERDNARLNETLDRQLGHIEFYYVGRELSLHFKEKSGDQLIVKVISTTHVKNVLDRSARYEHSVSFPDDIEYVSLCITDGSGHSQLYTSRELASMRARLPSKIDRLRVQFDVPRKDKITIQSIYMMTKPLWYEEPMVTARLIAGTMRVTISKDPTLENLVVNCNSLAFEELLPAKPSPEKTTETELTVPGPLFPGQGISVAWKWPT